MAHPDCPETKESLGLSGRPVTSMEDVQDP